jgi:hypothetical protein
MKKTVFITGTSSGFGKAAARLFAKSGWNIVATMRQPEVEQELGRLSDGLVIRLDVQDRASIAEAIESGMPAWEEADSSEQEMPFNIRMGAPELAAVTGFAVLKQWAWGAATVESDPLACQNPCPARAVCHHGPSL